jgi:hypothetical protein
MPGFEAVVGIPVVIEDGLVPCLFLVAAFALVTEAIGVYVPDRVAINAVFRGIFVLLFYVAGIAVHPLVRKLQLEFGLVMIEFELTPAHGVVATIAFFSQVAVVGVVLGMTVVTAVFGLAIFFIFQVAAAAFGQLVPADQLVVGEPMIEGVPVEPDHGGVPPLMIAVASLAFLGSCILVLTVEALFTGDVLGHRLMIVAVQAELVLSGVAQPDVAIGALRFEFIMARDQFARHEKLFDFSGLRDPAADDTEQQAKKNKSSHQ